MLGIGLSLTGRLKSSVSISPPSTFDPATLFALNETGVWLDPSDTTTLFQDTLGITPVTATGQSVRLALDKSKGLALGTELLTNGDFASGTTGWTTLQGGGTTAVVSGELEVTGNNTTNFVNVLQTNVPVTVGRLYRIQVTARRGTTTANVGIYTTSGLAADTLFTTSTTSQTLTAYFTSGTSTVSIGLRMLASSGNVTGTSYFDNVSVREVLGNHLFQSNTALAPTYQIDGSGKRYLNFDGSDDFLATDAGILVDPTSLVTPGPDLIVNGDFSSATGWTITGTGLTINTTAGQLEFSSAPLNSRATQAFGVASRVYAITYTLVSRSTGSVRGYAGGNTFGTNRSVPGTYTDYVVCGSTNSEVGVAAATTTTGVVDNVSVRDVTYQTAQVFAGLRKESDAAFAVVVETSSSVSTTNGALALSAPQSTGGANYGVVARNTAQVANNLSSYTAPITNVLAGLIDFNASTQGDAFDSYVNNISIAGGFAGTYTQGGGFTPQRVFVGRRGGTTSPFTGRIYGLVLRFGPTPSAQTISDMNNWMNDKTGAY